MSKKITLDLFVEERTFVPQDGGEPRTYFAVSTEIDGTSIKLAVPTDSKQLFNYLVKKEFE